MSKLPKVALIGHGSIGKRYAAILRYLGVPYDVHDPIQSMHSELKNCDVAIIASPTDTHISYCLELKELNKPFLCEKPISTDFAAVKEVVSELIGYPGFIGCNYKYVLDIYKIKPPYKVKYDYYNTGQDGLNWDCCQLLYLDPEAELVKASPRWNVSINDVWIKYRQLEESYIRMLSDLVKERWWVLWNFSDGLEMTRAVVRRNEKDIDRDPS